MWADIEVQLCETFAGARLFRFSRGKQIVFIPIHEFVGSAGSGLRILAMSGMAVIRKSEIDSLTRRIASANGGPAQPVIGAVGWNGQHFALPSGRVVSPRKGTAPETTIVAKRSRGEPSGTLDDWLTGVAEPLVGQSIPMFAICLAFMPAILRLSARAENGGFELVGKGGIGKTTVQRLMASVVGRPTADLDNSYVVTADSTLNALERVMADHADLPLIIDEASLFFAGESDAKRAESFKALAFKLSAGTEKERLSGGTPRAPVRLAYLVSTNEALASLLGKRSDAALAATDRLISIPISPDRPWGVFDYLPKGFDSASSYAAQVTQAAVSFHGRAFVRFISHLVQARAANENALRATIRKHVSTFTAHAKVDANNGSQIRVAEAFGLVYAAGRLAQSYGALPASWRVGPAVLATYSLYRASIALPPPFDERLAGLARSKHVAQAGDRRARLAVDPSSDVVGIVQSLGSARYLYIPANKIERAFPDWKRLQNDAVVKRMLDASENGHLTVKRRLVKSAKPMRAYSFKLPESAQPKK